MQVRLLAMSLCQWEPKMRRRALAQLKPLDRRRRLCFTPCRHTEAQAHPRRAPEAAEQAGPGVLGSCWVGLLLAASQSSLASTLETWHSSRLCPSG